MIKVLVICPNNDDATSFYRGMGPFARLAKDPSLGSMQIFFTSEVKWSSVSLADIVFMQRPFSPSHLKAAQVVKTCRVPLWVDYDDDLFSVGSDNPTHSIYSSDMTKKNVAKIIAMSDAVTVSTPAIKKRFDPLNKNIVVIPNAIDDWAFEYRSQRRSPREKVVFWRGGSTHQKDLMMVTEELMAIANEPSLSDWKFHFQGYNAFWLTDEMPPNRTFVADNLDPFLYMRFIHDLCPSLMIVPLAPTEFNLAKSNIAWIEGSFAGATVIAPEIAEFQRPGVITYTNAEHFGQQLRRAMAGEWDLEGMNQASWSYIAKNLTLTETNKIRSCVVAALLNKPRGFSIG